jgi:hypothetical protein
LCLSLFLLKLASLLFCLAISFRSFARQSIDLLSACDVVWLTSTNRLVSGIIAHLELLAFRLIRHTFNSQRPSKVTPTTTSYRILVHEHCPVRKFLCDAWRQVDLATTPRRPKRRVSEWRQSQRLQGRIQRGQHMWIDTSEVARVNGPAKRIDRNHRDRTRNRKIHELPLNQLRVA